MERGEADPKIEYPNSKEDMLTRIGAEAELHLLILAKERANFMESPIAQVMPAENPSLSNYMIINNMIIMIIKAAETPGFLLPQVILQLTPIQFTEHQCTFLKTK